MARRRARRDRLHPRGRAADPERRRSGCASETADASTRSADEDPAPTSTAGTTTARFPEPGRRAVVVAHSRAASRVIVDAGQRLAHRAADLGRLGGLLEAVGVQALDLAADGERDAGDAPGRRPVGAERDVGGDLQRLRACRRPCRSRWTATSRSTAECAAAMSSSGLVVPPASSAARLGKLTSKVPTLELDSSTWPEPSCRVPFQAVRAVRVGMRTSCGRGRPRPGRRCAGLYRVGCATADRRRGRRG